MKRFKTKMKTDKKVFKRTAMKTHKKNLAVNHGRGGIRL